MWSMWYRRLQAVSQFPLRDSREKRTNERARTSPAALKRDARIEPLMSVVAASSNCIIVMRG